MNMGTRFAGWLAMIMLAAGCARQSTPSAAPAGPVYPRLQASVEDQHPGLAAQGMGKPVSGAMPVQAGAAAPMTTPTTALEMPIDLPTVLRLADADALEVKLAGERLAEARARRLSADFQFLPTISPGVQRRWHRGEIQAVDGTFLHDIDKQSATVGVGAAVEWRLGEAVFQSLAARRRVTAGVAGLQSSKNAARLASVNAFFNLVLARADQAIVEDRIGQAEETVRITQAQHEAGAGLLSEVRRAEATRAEVRQRLAAARERVRLASLELTNVLHIDPLVSLTPSQEPQEQIQLVPERTIPELVALGLEQRPDLAESRARWAALDNEAKATTIGPWIPALKAEAFGGGLGPRPGDTRSTADYAVGLQWNIGRGGVGDVSRSRVAKSLQQQEAIRYEQLADQMARDVIAQNAHLEATREQIALAREEIRAAEETLRLSRERMRSGAALTIEVLNAEEALFSAKLRAAQGINEYNKAQYGLLQTIGGIGKAEGK